MNEADVTLAILGDEAAYHRLVQATAATVCSIALAIVRNVEASEDVAQEVFFAAWRNLRKLRNPASFLPWLRQTTRNQANLWLREHLRERERTVHAADSLLATAADPRPTPVDDALAEEERRILAGVLDALSEDAREVVLLYYREGSSAKHVAALLGISEDAVKQRLSRARAAMRAEVLEKFGRAAVRTAPGVAFVTVIGASLGSAAPSAAAAVVGAKSTGGKIAAGLVSLSMLAGALGAALGTVMGMKHLEPYFDEEEHRALDRFRNRSLALTSLGTIAMVWVTAATHHALPRLAVLVAFYAAFAWLYGAQLPPILERRYEWERSLDPEGAAKERRRWMVKTIAQAAGAAASGMVIGSIVARWIAA